MGYVEKSGGPAHRGNHNGAGDYGPAEKNVLENRKKIWFSVIFSMLGLIVVQSCISIFISISNTLLEMIITAVAYLLLPYIVILGKMEKVANWHLFVPYFGGLAFGPLSSENRDDRGGSLEVR